jgi:hypothetical protein
VGINLTIAANLPLNVVQQAGDITKPTHAESPAYFLDDRGPDFL